MILAWQKVKGKQLNILELKVGSTYFEQQP